MALAIPRRRSAPRRNPSFMGLSFGTGSVVVGAALRLLGKVIGAAAVRTVGSAEENQISGGVSPTTGMRWSFWNHFVCVASGLLAGGLVGRFLPGRNAAQLIFEGALDLSVQKAFWSELVHRTDAGPKWLGAADEGDVLEDSRSGKTWIRQGGKWVAMLGLQEKSTLDGLEYATSLGRSPHRRRGRPMGHLLPGDFNNTDTDNTGRYTDTASADVYAAAYQR